MSILSDSKNIKSFDGTDLYLAKEVPAGCKAVVVVVHGLAEHLGRYGYLKDRLNAFGYGVYRYDNRGHGRSGGERGYLSSFTDYIADADVIVTMARKENPGVPVFMLGHSMGGFIAAAYGVKHPEKLQGIILSGAATASIIEVVNALGPDTDPLTRLPNSLSALICTDEKVVEDYDTDPLVLKEITAKLMLEFGAGIRWLEGNLKSFHYPCLILHGGDDRIVPQRCSQLFYEKISSSDKELKIYEGLFHEILNESKRDQVIEDIHNWMELRR